MQLHKLTADFAISAQVTVDDVKELAARGIRTLICNRPDGEATDQLHRTRSAVQRQQKA